MSETRLVERELLQLMLLEHKSIESVMANRLRSFHFRSPEHALMFDAIMAAFEKGIWGIDSVTALEELNRAGRLEEAGGIPAVTDILSAKYPERSVDQLIEMVRSRF